MVSLNAMPAVCDPGFARVKPVAAVGDTVIVPEPLIVGEVAEAVSVFAAAS